jgi:hypothetical protein
MWKVWYGGREMGYRTAALGIAHARASKAHESERRG